MASRLAAGKDTAIDQHGQTISASEHGPRRTRAKLLARFADVTRSPDYKRKRLQYVPKSRTR
jgi:hypothetical protein